MDDQNIILGQIDAGVIRFDLWILPCLDRAHEDTCQHCGRYLDGRLQCRQVIDNGNRAGAFRYLDHGRHTDHFVIAEWCIGCAEIDGSSLHLLDAAATADGLVIDLHVAVLRLEVSGPTRHDGINERAARTHQRNRTRAA